MERDRKRLKMLLASLFALNRPHSYTSSEAFRTKLLYLVLLSLYRSLFWELKDKINKIKNLQFYPKASEPCLNFDISSVGYLETHDLVRQSKQFSGFITIKGGQFRIFLDV